MSESVPPGSPHDTAHHSRSIWFTPLGQVFGGQAGGRLDYRQLVESASLPAPTAEVALRCVRRTRLWKSEKAAVAEELVSHFADGLEAGVSAEELVDSFGDVRRAAKLIRRAKKRNRPLAWHGMRYAFRGIAAVVLIYVALGVYYIVGRPSPSIDYRPQLNAAALAVPEDGRAWPLYREALLQLEPEPAFDRFNRVPRPGEAGWEEADAYLANQTSALALVRQAAQRPGLGFVVGYELSPEDRELWPESDAWFAFPSDDESVLLNVRLMYLSTLRQLTRILVLDSHRAAAAGEGEVVLQNMTAMLGMARHANETPFIINNLVAISIVSQALQTAGDILAGQPGLLTDEQLLQLAHRFAACDDSFRIRFDGERMSFLDIVQRVYTDNGRGDGRITVQGLRRIMSIGSSPGQDETVLDEPFVAPLIAPAVGILSASRRDLVDEYNRVMDAMEVEARLPLWELDNLATEEQIMQWKIGTISRVRYLLPSIFMPALTKVHISSEMGIAERDAILVALALELYRRHHGAWPDNLDALTPDLLPAVPPDRFDGKPMRYALIGGEPVLYSIGYDRDDDGGRPPVYAASGLPNYEAAQRWASKEELARRRPLNMSDDGDWILWPQAVEPLIDYGPEDEGEDQ